MSSNYVASVLGMSEGSASTNILPSLRMINLIDENGNTNQELAKKFRDDQKHKDFCEEILKKNYPQEVRDAFPDASSDRERVKSWFMNHSGVGASAAQRIVIFYFALLQADPNVSSLVLTNKKKKKATSKTTKKKTTEKPKTIKDEQKNIASSNVIPQGKELPDLNINIQIHISSDATPDQIEKIFEAMSKHLFRNK